MKAWRQRRLDTIVAFFPDEVLLFTGSCHSKSQRHSVYLLESKPFLHFLPYLIPSAYPEELAIPFYPL